MNPPKIKIKRYKGEDISLDDNNFLNFCYTEDFNLGFPIIEFALRDNLFTLLREGLYGDEELIIEEFENNNFRFTDKHFKIKSIGSAGVAPKPGAAQTIKLIAIDKNYDALLKSQGSIYFLPTEKKSISGLLNKLLAAVGIAETDTFNITVEDTAPLEDQGFQNLFIPYSRDSIKVIRKLSNYAVTPGGMQGKGGYVFFINRKGLNFVPVSNLFVDVNDKTPYLQITDMTSGYGISSLKLSTFNAFTNFITGHEKRIMGFNLLEKDYNTIKYSPNAKYIEYSKYKDGSETDSNIQTMPVIQVPNTKSIPFPKDFSKGNVKTYYTPLDNPAVLKALADKIHYSQMLNYALEIDLDMTGGMPDFTIGEMVNIEFKTTDADAWSSINGGWLLKSFSYVYPGDNVLLKLVRIGIGTLPDGFVKQGE
jgi:hypothetical protein